jgi:hypothetical protein
MFAGMLVVWLLGALLGYGLALLAGQGATTSRSSGGGVGHLGSANIADAEQKLGIHLPYVRTYGYWGRPIHVPAGHTPVLSVLVSGTSYAAIASGSQDVEIRRQAAAVRAIPGTVYLALQHEPENDPALGSPAQYQAVWRHYVAVYRAAGVTNVRWTWIMMAYSFASNRANQFYPGDSTINIVAADGYDWGGTGVSGDTHRTFDQVFADFHAFGLQHGKQEIIAEFGAKSGQPQSAQWINDANAILRSWPDVIAQCWFNQNRFSIGRDQVPALRAMARGSG